MTNLLKCPECGNDEFDQFRTTSYDELCVVSFSLRGEIEDERIENQECIGEESSEAYRCKSCGWELVDKDGDPIYVGERLLLNGFSMYRSLSADAISP